MTATTSGLSQSNADARYVEKSTRKYVYDRRATLDSTLPGDLDSYLQGSGSVGTKIDGGAVVFHATCTNTSGDEAWIFANPATVTGNQADGPFLASKNVEFILPIRAVEVGDTNNELGFDLFEFDGAQQNSIGILYSGSGSANWQFKTQTEGTATTTDTGLAADTVLTWWKFKCSASLVTLSRSTDGNSYSQVATSSTNIPTENLCFRIYAINSGGAANSAMHCLQFLAEQDV